jgi:hypothetical protein
LLLKPLIGHLKSLAWSFEENVITFSEKNKSMMILLDVTTFDYGLLLTIVTSESFLFNHKSKELTTVCVKECENYK